MGFRFRKAGKRIVIDARGLPPVCAYHPDTPASVTCSECANPICSGCATTLPTFAPACARCRARFLGRRRLVSLAQMAGGVVVALGVVALAVHDRASPRVAPATPEPLPDLDDHQTRRLRAGVEREPCDRVRIVELADRLVGTGENREALQVAGRFLKECGEHARLRWVTYEAHRRLGEWDAAIAQVDMLLARNRYDRDYWIWRGLVHEERGDLARAISDYQQALALEPRLADIPFNLATLFERTGRPCEAIFPLEQFVHHYPEIPQVGQVRDRILALHGSGKCGDYAARGHALVTFGSSDGILAVATINGRQRGRFLIDTGASYVALTARFARKLGLDSADRGRAVLVRTANGPVAARPITLDRIELQGASASRVSALVMDSLPDELDGLLGLSFLSRFEVKINRQRGRLELSTSGRRERSREQADEP